MFVNKVNSVSINKTMNFKGYEHVRNARGEDLIRFGIPYDSENEACEMRIYRASQTPNLDYKIDENPIAKIKIEADGTLVNIQNITNLGREEDCFYNFVITDKKSGKILRELADTGYNFKKQGDIYVSRVSNQKASKKLEGVKGDYWYKTSDYGEGDKISDYKYSLLKRSGTAPRVQGAGYMLIPDSFKPGVEYEGYDSVNTGKIKYDINKQKNMENITKTFTNSFGGSMASIEWAADYLKEKGYTYVFIPPYTNGDTVSSIGYWDEDNFKIADRMGNMENFANIVEKYYNHDLVQVFDTTLTAEGILGKHFQNLLRHAESDNNQFKYWFKINDLKNKSQGLGFVPLNMENLRIKRVNPAYIAQEQSDGTYKIVPNPHYDRTKETYTQYYDSSLVSEEQVKSPDLIKSYDKQPEHDLKINSHNDTIVLYTVPERDETEREFANNIKVINFLNKHCGKNIKLDSAEGAIIAAQYSNTKLQTKTETGYVTWDANPDMAKYNYCISGYDEKLLQSIPDENIRNEERKKIIKGTYEIRDVATQVPRYWAGKVKDIQTVYTAQVIKSAKTASAINKLIEEGKLPQKGKISDEAINNILNGQYILDKKGILSKDDTTIKALMRLPLDAIEVNSLTSGILSTSYFSNRATNEDTIGMTRFELYKENNPHLVEPYSKIYNKVNSLYSGVLKDFADEIIKKINSESSHKLLNADGTYTEYGEYIIELFGQDIAKYAFLKSLTGDKLKTKILDNGRITYKYEQIKEDTSLKALGIKGNPEQEAEQLESLMRKGLKKLGKSDINYVSESISKRIQGTDTLSFRLAEAITKEAGLGAAFRLDAAKDRMDTDSVKNRDDHFDDYWYNLIKADKEIAKAIKTENPYAAIFAEQTDIADTMRYTYGSKSNPFDGNTNLGGRFNGEPDALGKYFAETGFTEAAYSYFFTELLTAFSNTFDKGTGFSETHDEFKEKLELLLQTRTPDYLRNLYTFMGNQDKARMVHGLSVNMQLFHSPTMYTYSPFGDAEFNVAHDDRMEIIRVLSGAENQKDVPIELRLNVDNNDYFKTVSSRAVAQSAALIDAVNDSLKGVISEEEIKNINSALVDLANGAFLNEQGAPAMTHINIPEISTLKNAINELLKLAEEKHGAHFTVTERNALCESIESQINSMDLTDFLVRGGFSWQSKDSDGNNIGEKNRKYLSDLTGSGNTDKYCLYTVQLARLMKKAYEETAPSDKKGINQAIVDAAKDFAEKYDRNTVVSKTSPFETYENFNLANRKNGYASRDFEMAMRNAIKQAEFKSGKTISKKEEIIETVANAASEPGITKAAMIMEFLSSLCGIPTMYGGDEFGQTGYEDPSRNPWIGNRNVQKWSRYEDKNAVGYNHIRRNETLMNGAMGTRKDLPIFNSGTPHLMDVIVNSKNRDDIKKRLAEIKAMLDNRSISEEEKKKLLNERYELNNQLAIVSHMIYSADGELAIAVLNAGHIEAGNRVNYFEKYGLKTEQERRKFFAENNIESIDPHNPYIPIQKKAEIDMLLLGAGLAIPAGTILINSNSKDKDEYIVQKLQNGRQAIVKRGGGKIIIDGKTAKNGVLKLIKKISFKGRKSSVNYLNTRIHIAPNKYNNNVEITNGKNLSILSE